MKIHNVRLGFATNSSSSHSIVIDSPLGEFGYDDDGYEWQDFLLKTRESKGKYLAAQVYQNLEHLGGHLPTLICQQLFSGTDPRFPVPVEFPVREDPERHWDNPMNIDHQSVLQFPAEYGNQGSMDMEFVAEFYRSVVENDRISLCGGNDNDERYDYGGNIVDYPIPRDYGRRRIICRKDRSYWIIFNMLTGSKVRMSFADDSAPYEYSDTPELVDVKITGWCPHSKSCPWCYQDSDLDGKHAPLSLVKEAAAALGKMKAFEVALGGGEATMHPDFKEILKIFRDVGIIPNFTTFGMKWADDPATFEAVYNYAGGFALSVSEDSNTWRDRLDEVVGFIDSAGEVKNGEASDAIWSRYESRNRFMVQVILGVNSDDFIEEVFAAMKDRHMYSCTLLGYKSFGRGMKMAPKHSNSLARIINAAKANYIRLGVDTQVVNDYAVDLEAANIDSLLWTKAEGKFSCYLDLIGKKVARDSYTVGGLSFEPGGIFETVKKSFPF